MKRTRRIVCYAINGSGLGHLTRLISVARWLRRFVTLLEDQPPEVYFLTSSDASDVLARAGFASFKIPSKTVAGRADYDKIEYRRLAKHFVWQVLGVFSPDLLVVDTFPSGCFDELFQVLDGPYKKGFIFRGVKPEYAARPIFRSALRLYDSVVIPHGRDTSYPEQLDPDIQASFGGEVINFERDELLPRDVARRQLGVTPDQHMIYVSAGGGGDPDAPQTLQSLVSALRDQPKLHLLVGAGPLYRGNRLAGPRLTWLESPNVWRYFAGCDAAVSAAGYNTFHELTYAGVPTLFYAQEKIADDQARRIAQAQAMGVCLHLSDVTDTSAMREGLAQLLEPAKREAIRQACFRFISMNGARKCALELLRPVYADSRLSWADQVLTPSLVQALERIGNGSTSVLSRWLLPLMPCEQLDTITNYPGFDAVLGLLSHDAAEEVQQVLAARPDAQDHGALQRSLIALVSAIERYRDASSNAAGFPEEVLKTLLAAMKKQPDNPGNGSRPAWIRTAVDRVHRLITLDDVGHPAPDVLRLYRVFPSIEDASVEEAFDLFEVVLRRRTALGDPPHEIMHQLQVIKMAHPKITSPILESHLEGTTT